MPVFPGFNTNVRYNGTTYHVQTEVNSKGDSHTISTLIYDKGRICHNHNTQLEEHLTQERELLSSTIESQHKAIIKKLISNDIDSVSQTDSNDIDFIQLYSSNPAFSTKQDAGDISTIINTLILENSEKS